MFKFAVALAFVAILLVVFAFGFALVAPTSSSPEAAEPIIAFMAQGGVLLLFGSLVMGVIAIIQMLCRPFFKN